VLVTVGEAMKQQQSWIYGNHNTEKKAWKTKTGPRPTLLSKDTGRDIAELGATMSSRECWQTVVMGSGAPD